MDLCGIRTLCIWLCTEEENVSECGIIVYKTRAEEMDSSKNTHAGHIRDVRAHTHTHIHIHRKGLCVQTGQLLAAHRCFYD